LSKPIASFGSVAGAPASPHAKLVPTAPTTHDAVHGSRHPIVRYVGFRSTTNGREYTMQVSDGLSSRSFVLIISHQAFASRQARFQDAPDVCSGKLRRELAADPDLLPCDSMAVTAQDLLDYKDTREHRLATGKHARAKP
jgi:hypothetical protein